MNGQHNASVGQSGLPKA